MTKTNLPATLMCDFYKVSHRGLYPKGTEFIYSTFTPRSSKHGDNVPAVVAFGLQGFIKKYLIDYFNENFFYRPKTDIIEEYSRVIKYTLGIEEPDTSHIEALHDLGYLPIRIKSLEEGTLVPIKTPMLTIENTHKDFFWLTNYLETILSTQLWQPTTSATKAREFRVLLDHYAMKTVGNTNDVLFQGHDFSMRGMSSLETVEMSGAAHLLSFCGSDTIPAILYHEKYYNANIEKELVASSVVATEHSIMCSLTDPDTGRDEYEAFRYLINEASPKGIMSIVSDTYDFWRVVEETLPKLKEDIMNREGKIVIRPDSGDPVKILCGLDLPIYNSIQEGIEDLTSGNYHTEKQSYSFRVGDTKCIVKRGTTENGEPYTDGFYKDMTAEEKGLIECLWDIFSGTITEKGYKMLDPHIGAIYGDSITLETAHDICAILERKGFASTNVVLGLGSFYYQFNTRDTFGFAMKATHSCINGQEKMLFKDPKTDDGTKRSQRGMVVVLEEDGKITYKDGLTSSEQYEYKDFDLLKDVFINGELLRETSLAEIRERIEKSIEY